jgi:hypothetical protein
MIKLFSSCLLILIPCLSVIAQPGSNVKKPSPIDPFCDSLQLILKNSKNGFLNYRYNEIQGTVSVSYSTTLPALGFGKKYIQTGSVSPHKQKIAATLPYYIATSEFKEINEARQFYSTIKNKLGLCVKPVSQDSLVKPGFDRYTSFQVSKAVNDSFVTIELLILPDPKSNLVALRLFHNKASVLKGVMKNPPVAASANKNHYTRILPLLQALMEYSAKNFTAIRKDLLQNEKWSPTYSCIVTFSDFGFPKIEYVTNNLWNQYTTNRFIKDYETAKRRFDELASEIEQCNTTFSYQRYEPRSKPDEKWWYYDLTRTDVDGKSYKNTLRLELKKFEYGEGYYITLEFRKSV